MSSELGDVGHVRLLSGVYVSGLIAVVLFLFASAAGPIARDLAAFPIGLVPLVAAEVIYRDAMAINRQSGYKVHNATFLSLASLVVWVVVLPWYVFVRRGEALSVQKGLRQDADTSAVIHSTSPKFSTNFCPNCGHPVQTDAAFCNTCGFSLAPVRSESTTAGRSPAVPKMDYSTPIFFGVMGSIILILGAGELVGLTQALFNAPLNGRFDLAVSTIMITVGIVFVGTATGVYRGARKKSLESDSSKRPSQ